MIKNIIILLLITVWACGMGGKSHLKDYQEPKRDDVEQFYWIPKGKCSFHSQECSKRKRNGKCEKFKPINKMASIIVPEPLCSELRAGNFILIKRSLVFGK